jgi:thiaminase
MKDLTSPSRFARGVSSNSSSRLPRATGEERELTATEEALLDDQREQCVRRFDESVFFQRLAAGVVTGEALGYIFGQYGHFRIQLHRWFAFCILLAKDASQPAQRQSIMALADHVFTDLRDDHDVLFAECLECFGLPAGTLYAGSPSPATRTYIESFMDDTRASAATWLEATAALAGRELSVALRNQRLIRSYFAPRDQTAPIWIGLHAELEVDHFLDALRPVLAERALGTASLAALHLAVGGAFGRHAEYLDALLDEYEALQASSTRT